MCFCFKLCGIKSGALRKYFIAKDVFLSQESVYEVDVLTVSVFLSAGLDVVINH